MISHTDVATANVLRTLGHEEARDALRGILDREPHLVGLQEWGVSRHGLLRDTGTVRLPLIGRAHLHGHAPGRLDDYIWVSAPPLLGGCPVGARKDRFDLLDWRFRVVGWLGRSDRNAGPPPIAVPRVVTVAVFFDRQRGRVVSMLSFHLTPRVQAQGEYRLDRPVLVAHHQAEVRGLNAMVGQQRGLGRVVYAVGDSNFDGLRLAGLTSAWAGRESEPGTLGSSRRKIDDVHGPGPAASVILLSNASDHKAVIVRRTDG